jgi:hypothetical protein
MVNEIVK